MRKKKYKSSITENYRIKKKYIFDGIPLTLSQTTNCRLFQTERVCRRQFKI